MARKYTMSDDALAVRQGKRTISEETRKARSAHMKELCEKNRKPPRIRVMVDKELAEKAQSMHGSIDKALEIATTL